MPLLLWSRNVSKCRFTLSVWMCFKVLERHHEVTDTETTSGLKANLSIKSLFFFFFKSLKPIKSGGQRLFCFKIDGDDDNRCAYGDDVEAPISLRSLWALSPVWSRPKRS